MERLPLAEDSGYDFKSSQETSTQNLIYNITFSFKG